MIRGADHVTSAAGRDQECRSCDQEYRSCDQGC